MGSARFSGAARTRIQLGPDTREKCVRLASATHAGPKKTIRRARYELITDTNRYGRFGRQENVQGAAVHPVVTAKEFRLTETS